MYLRLSRLREGKVLGDGEILVLSEYFEAR